MNFQKYVAAGNDFIAFNGIDNSIDDLESFAKKVCHRQFGIGADGILVCEQSLESTIKMVYYNSDGTEGEMCGNGIRSFAKFVYDNQIIIDERFTVETLDGEKNIMLEVIDGKVSSVLVDMGYPTFKGNEIPIKVEKDKVIEETIRIDNVDYVYSAVLVGVPHVVIFVEDIGEININDLGRKIENHELFPCKTNVNFIEINNKEDINIYTWERGAGRTLGCGTGSCASVVIGNKLKKLHPNVRVNTEGGNLKVDLDKDFRITMSGDAKLVAKGEFYME